MSELVKQISDFLILMLKINLNKFTNFNQACLNTFLYNITWDLDSKSLNTVFTPP